MGKRGRKKAAIETPQTPDSGKRGQAQRLILSEGDRTVVSTTPTVGPLLGQGWPNDPNTDNAPVKVAAALGGRLTVDTEYSFFGSPHVVMPPPIADREWSLFRLDSKAMRRISPVRLMEMLADLSPDVSRALWDFLRLCNPGWECVVMTQKMKGEPDPKGQKLVEDFFSTLEVYYGTVDVVIGRLFMGAFLRGALMAELVLELDGRGMADLATPDASTVRFIRSQDQTRGPIWQLSQWQNRPSPVPTVVGGFVPLTWPTIKYVPIDPFPGVPYGRPLASPALFTTLFLLGLFHDLRRVISQQGYPRLDISVSMERIKASMPSKILNDPVEYKNWVNRTIAEVERAYEKLEPDSTFVHTDVVTMNRPLGTVDSSSLGAIDGLIMALERMSVRALKTMPFMMASTQTTTETLANREWEVQSSGIVAIQKHAASVLSQLLELGLQSVGHQACVCWTFDQLRKTEELRDAQSKAIRIANAWNSYAHGFISIDQAANLAEGQDADNPEPRYLQKGNIGMDVLTDNASPREDGSMRVLPVIVPTQEAS